MNKEIKNAIEQLQHTISFFEDIEDGRNLEIDFIDITAIKILIEYIKDSTPNSVIRAKIKELKSKCGGNVFHIQQTINAEIRLLEEILKEGEKKL